MRTSSVPFVGTLLLGCLLTAPARADPSPEDRALARTLFEDGRALTKDGRYAEGCAKLEESQRLDPGMGTLYNLADCLEHLGKTASAWSLFSEVADAARRGGQSERETVARARVATLAPKLSRMKLHMAPPLPAGLEIRLDGKVSSSALLDAEVPVDPGEHRVRASAAGKTAYETTVLIDPSARVTPVDLPPLADAAAAPPDVPVEASQVAPPPSAGPGWQKTVAVVLGAGGLVALGLGTFFGVQAASRWTDARDTCTGNVCDDQGYAKWDSARSSAGLSTITFSAGAGLAVAAVLLWVTAPSDRHAAAIRPRTPLPARASLR